jgi:chemotaxis signal transduction protein
MDGVAAGRGKVVDLVDSAELLGLTDDEIVAD